MLILFTYTNKKIPVKYYFNGLSIIEAEKTGSQESYTIQRNIIKLQITCKSHTFGNTREI